MTSGEDNGFSYSVLLIKSGIICLTGRPKRGKVREEDCSGDPQSFKCRAEMTHDYERQFTVYGPGARTTARAAVGGCAGHGAGQAAAFCPDAPISSHGLPTSGCPVAAMPRINPDKPGYARLCSLMTIFLDLAHGQYAGDGMSTPAPTPTLWLPKPATKWFPNITKPLRGTWSPEEREKTPHVKILRLAQVRVAQVWGNAEKYFMDLHDFSPFFMDLHAGRPVLPRFSRFPRGGAFRRDAEMDPPTFAGKLRRGRRDAGATHSRPGPPCPAQVVDFPRI